VGVTDVAGRGRRAVFLDRDGVLNASRHVDGVPRPPARLEDLRLLPGVVEACHRLRDARFLLVVATNQPDVARGDQSLECVEQMNAALRAMLPLDDVLVCYHDDSDDCTCRKPRPGLLLEAARRWRIELSRSFMVGDRWRDVAAGRSAGCRTVLVRGSAEAVAVAPDHATDSLGDAAEWILAAAAVRGAE
jgi:D-glycero-D-manno-heptose 1,7-bisphosphate phosphatase